MPTEEELALYGLMAVAEETTKLAESTIRELPAELTRELAPRLASIEESTASAQAALAALPGVVEEAEKRIRSTGIRSALFGGGVCLAVGAIVAFAFWQWHANLKVAIQAEEAKLAELRSNTWGLRLHEDNKGRFIVLPEGVSIETDWNVGKSPAIRIVSSEKEKGQA